MLPFPDVGMGYYQGVISDRPQKLRIHAFGLADDNESKFYHLLTEIKTFGIGIGKSILYRDSATTPDPDPDPEQRWFNPAMLINRSMCKFIVFWIEKDVGCLYVGHIASLKINHKRRKGEDVYSLLIHYPDYDYRNYDTPINTIFFMFYSGNLTKHITVFADESQVRTLLIKSIRDKLEDSNKKNIFDMALEKFILEEIKYYDRYGRYFKPLHYYLQNGAKIPSFANVSLFQENFNRLFKMLHHNNNEDDEGELLFLKLNEFGAYRFYSFSVFNNNPQLYELTQHFNTGPSHFNTVTRDFLLKNTVFITVRHFIPAFYYLNVVDLHCLFSSDVSQQLIFETTNNAGFSAAVP